MAREGFCNHTLSGCTPDHHSLGVCSYSTYSSDLPPEYQYFDDGSHGGSLETADYCPYYKPFTYTDARTSHCDVAANAPSDNYFAESYGGSALCFESSLSQVVYQNGVGFLANGGNQRNTGCHKTRCTSGVLELEVLRSNGQSGWLQCPSAGAHVTPPSDWQVQGSIRCPELAALLCDAHSCPGLPCDGTDECQAGVCTCGTAFGTSCTPLQSQPSSPPVPQTPPPPPPRLPLPPSVPSPPVAPAPASPGAKYQTAVRFEATVAGSISEFDGDAYKASLATFLSGAEVTVASTDISLTVTSASVVVVSTIVVPSANAASTLVATISSMSTASLSSALAVTVENVQSPVTVTVLVSAPPPSPSTSSSGSGSGAGVPVALLACGGIAVLVGGAGVNLYLKRLARRKKRAGDVNPVTV